jgi:hypothetical protein
MTTIIFDSTTYRNANRSFGEGLEPPTDEYGNPVPKAPATALDFAWKSQCDARETELEGGPVMMSEAERHHLAVFHLSQALPWEEQELAEFGVRTRF